MFLGLRARRAPGHCGEARDASAWLMDHGSERVRPLTRRARTGRDRPLWGVVVSRLSCPVRAPEDRCADRTALSIGPPAPLGPLAVPAPTSAIAREAETSSSERVHNGLSGLRGNDEGGVRGSTAASCRC